MSDQSQRGGDESGPAGGGARRPGAGIVWTLGPAALVVGALAVRYDIPWPAAVAAIAALTGAGLLAARPPAERRISGLRPARRTPWPDGGMKLLAEGLADPCILTDRAGIVRFANGRAAERFGPLPPGEPLSLKLRVPALHDAIARIGVGGPAETVPWTERVPAERWLTAHLSPITLPGGGGRPDFVLVVIEDQTEQHRAERMRVDFVANASHELRTPLASLAGFIDTLQGPARNDAAARERFLAIMGGQAARMKRLIDDLLSLSHIEMKAHMRPETTVELGEIVGHVVDTLTPLAEESRVRLVWTGPGVPMRVRGERDELVQVFSNLVENAIKYGGPDRTVEIAAADEGGLWAVAVTDHGPGIAAEHLPRLTERFYRVGDAAGRTRQGTGLGLAIVKHILNRHRGRLAIESSLGHGSTFTVRLAAADAAARGGEDRQGA